MLGKFAVLLMAVLFLAQWTFGQSTVTGALLTLTRLDDKLRSATHQCDVCVVRFRAKRANGGEQRKSNGPTLVATRFLEMLS